MASNGQLRRVVTELSQSHATSRLLWQFAACQSIWRRTLERIFPSDDPPAFELALAQEAPLQPWQERDNKTSSLSPLAGLLAPVMWLRGQTAKSRKSYYELRRNWYCLREGSRMSKVGRPLLNIAHCLECGKVCLPSMVCPHCYDKVRERTEELKEKLGKEFKHRHPAKEVQFVYEDDTFGTNARNHVIKLEGERPSWFSKSVLPRKGP